MNKSAIVIDNITKEYYIERPQTFKSWFKHIFSPFKKFTVIRDFSLKVDKGEFVLLIGENGCGKTTLLKLIAGITVPNRGKIVTFGKVAPLIELSAGFNYELTGRENILTYATILGVDKKTMVKIIPKIVSFSELKNFIDVPLKRYSSGMVSRLAFSIAIYSNPDILLLDEIFAAGDRKFIKKSIKKLLEFKKKGVTIMLSTHFEKSFPFADKSIFLSRL